METVPSEADKLLSRTCLCSQGTAPTGSWHASLQLDEYMNRSINKLSTKDEINTTKQKHIYYKTVSQQPSKFMTNTNVLRLLLLWLVAQYMASNAAEGRLHVDLLPDEPKCIISCINK